MYFLAIVPEENVRQGVLLPGYILCKTHGVSRTVTQWRVSNVMNGERCKWPKLLIDRPLEHPEMIDYLRCYRTRSHMHKGKYIYEKTKKYFPKGALFWFECDEYGVMTGETIYVMRVPDFSQGKITDQGKKRLLEYFNREQSEFTAVGHDYYSEPLKFSDIKVVMKEPKTRR